MLKFAAVVVPVQVSPAPQVAAPAVDTATVEAVAPLMIVAYCRSLVLVSVIWRRIFAFAVPVADAACAAEAFMARAAIAAPRRARFIP